MVAGEVNSIISWQEFDPVDKLIEHDEGALYWPLGDEQFFFVDFRRDADNNLTVWRRGGVEVVPWPGDLWAPLPKRPEGET